MLKQQLSDKELADLKKKITVINDRYRRIKQAQYNKGIESFYEARYRHLKLTGAGYISKNKLNEWLDKSKLTLINRLYQPSEEDDYKMSRTIGEYHKELAEFASTVTDNEGMSKNELYEWAENAMANVHEIIENYSQAIYAVSDLNDAVHRSSQLTPQEVDKIIKLSLNPETKSNMQLEIEKAAARVKDWQSKEESNPFE